MNPENYESVDEYVNVALAEFDKKYADLESFEGDPEIREFYKLACEEFFYKVNSERLNKVDSIDEKVDE